MTREDNHDEDCAENCSGSCDADHSPGARVAAFITSIASSVLGLSVSLFGLLSVIEFFIGYWQNGIAFMVLAFLVSPIGLPAIATLLLNLLDHLIGFFEGLVC